MDDSKIVIKRLKYINNSFPGLEWNEYLKNCNESFYTSRKDRLWYSVRGKGYIIWISSSYPRGTDNEIYWLIDFEISKNAHPDGMKYLDEILEGAVKVFSKMEIYTEEKE